jgi:hypothetical protein
MNKKVIIALSVLGLVLVIGGVFAFTRLRAKPVAEESTKQVKPFEPVNVIPVEERPYVTIEPNQNGRNLLITIHDLKKGAEKAEAEVEYQSGTLLQGAMVAFNLQTLPDSQDMLLGSCSAGGKCSYHEEVTGGSILLRFLGDEKYVLKNDWAFINNAEKETTFASRDSKFSLEGTGLARIPHGVILQSPGLPENTERKLLSAPYATAVDGAVRGALSVHIRLNEDVADATILAWTGTAWKELKTTVAEQTATASSDVLYDAYIAVE